MNVALVGVSQRRCCGHCEAHLSLPCQLPLLSRLSPSRPSLTSLPTLRTHVNIKHLSQFCACGISTCFYCISSVIIISCKVRREEA